MTTKFNVLGRDIALPWKVPLELLGTTMPGLVAIAMRAVRPEERDSRSFVGRFEFSKQSSLLFLFSLVVPVLIRLTILVAQVGFGMSDLSKLDVWVLVRVFLFNVLLGPLWEEIGWRGYLLPNLLEQFRFIPATLVVGLVWGFWHSVLYLVLRHVSVLSFVFTFAAIVGVSMILSVLYAATKGTLVMPVLFHASFNSAAVWVATVKSSYTLGAALLNVVVIWLVAIVTWRALRHRIDSQR